MEWGWSDVTISAKFPHHWPTRVFSSYSSVRGCLDQEVLLTLVCVSMDTVTPSTVTVTFPSLKLTKSSPNMSLCTMSHFLKIWGATFCYGSYLTVLDESNKTNINLLQHEFQSFNKHAWVKYFSIALKNWNKYWNICLMEWSSYCITKPLFFLTFLCIGVRLDLQNHRSDYVGIHVSERARDPLMTKTTDQLL